MPSHFGPSMRRFPWRLRQPSRLWTASATTLTGVLPMLPLTQASESVLNITMSRGRTQLHIFCLITRKKSWQSLIQMYHRIWWKKQNKQLYIDLLCCELCLLRFDFQSDQYSGRIRSDAPARGVWAWGPSVCERAAGREPGSDWYQRPQRADAHALGRQTRFSRYHPGAAGVKWCWLFCPIYVELYSRQSLCILQIILKSHFFFYFSTCHPSILLIFRSCAHVCALGWMSWTMMGRRLCMWPVVWGASSLSKLCWVVVLSVISLVVLATPFTVLWSTARSRKCISRWVWWFTKIHWSISHLSVPKLILPQISIQALYQQRSY